MMNQSFGPSEKPSAGRQRGGLTLSQEIHRALDSLDAARIGVLTKEAGAQDALRDPSAIFRRFQGEIRDDQTAERLHKIWTVLDVFSQTSMGNDRRLSTSAERCVVVLQAKNPPIAVSVAHQALDRGLALSPQTILATLSQAWNHAKTIEGLGSCVSLLESALIKGALAPTDRQTIGKCDALLATLCDPNPCHKRISSHYKPEMTLAEVSTRMLLGARLAQAVVGAGVVFSDSRNQERISLAIRGLSTVGVLASLQARHKVGEISQGSLIAAADEVGFQILGFQAKDANYDPQQQAAVGAALMGAALSLAHQCFCSESLLDGTDRTVRLYALSGATVATLFRAMERGKLELGDSERESIAVITSCALELEQDQRGADLQSATLNCALGLLVKRPGDLSEGGELAISAIRRANCVAHLLYHALPRITEVSFLKSASAVFGVAFEANPDGVNEYSSWHDAIDRRIVDIEKNRAQKVAPMSVSRRPQQSLGWFSQALKEGEEGRR